MPGSVTNTQQPLPLTTTTNVATGRVGGTGDSGLDGTEIPFSFLKDTSDPSAAVPLKGMAQDGTDSTDPNATQATGGVGLRGWLSTLVSLFRSGTAQVKNREVASTFGTGQVPVTSAGALIHAATPTRNLLTVRNIGTADMYIGGNGVTTGTGFLLHGGESQDVKAVSAVYGIVASTSTTAAYFEEVQ